MTSRLKVFFTILIISIYIVFSFSNLDVILSALLILSFGLIHGACDITLITTKLRKSSFQIKSKIIFLYVLLAFISFFVVYKLPVIGFMIFLIISSYHFGEQHFHMKLKKSKLKFWYFLFYGLLIFMIMIEIHRNIVLEVLNTLLNYNIGNFPTQIILLVCIIINFILWMIDYKRLKLSVWKELFYLMLISVLFYTTNLIVSFAAYFVIWHSIPSIFDQINYLYKEVSIKTAFLYLKKSGFYWAVSISGIVFLVLYKEIMGDDFYRITYSFVVSVTIPHMFVINNILSESN